MNKSLIRQNMLQSRRALSAADVSVLSCRAQRNFIASDVFRRARVLALYSPVHQEIATERIAAAAIEAGKRICYPRVAGQTLVFGEVASPEALRPGRFSIPEPLPAAPRLDGVIDVLLVPGLAFDVQGFRLGYGRGYYDRYLADVAAGVLAVGLCYDFQVCAAVPQEPHDRRLDWLVTESSVNSCHESVTDFT